jgi:hypothetical protein
MRILFAILLAMAGCAKEDLCGGDSSKGLTCLTVHVTGAIDAEATLDRLQVDVSYNDLRLPSSRTDKDVTQRFLVTPEMPLDGGVASLPIDFPVVFDDINAQPTQSGSRVLVVAYQGTTPVGYGFTPQDSYASLLTGMPPLHGAATVVLVPVHKDGVTHGCFNPTDLRTVHKTGPTCGGDCPACPAGENCSRSTDCASPTLACAFADDPRTQTYHQFCQ